MTDLARIKPQVGLLYNGIKAIPSHFLVLDVIQGLWAISGSCWARNRYLAEKVGLSKDRTRHIVYELRTMGFLISEEVYSDKEPFYTEWRILRPPKTSPVAMSDQQQPLAVPKEYSSKAVDNSSVKTTDNLFSSIMRKASALGIPFEHIRVQFNLFKHRIFRKGENEQLANELARDYIEEKLSIVAVSTSVRKPTALFHDACIHDYQPGKRAQANIGKPAKRPVSQPISNSTWKAGRNLSESREKVTLKPIIPKQEVPKDITKLDFYKDLRASQQTKLTL